MKRTTAMAAVLAATMPGLAGAQDAFLLDEIVITANLEETEAARSGATVTVITADELEATGESRVVDVLTRVPGLNVITRGPIGTQAGLTIRGASQNYVKVLVDGIDVADPSATQSFFDFGSMTTGDISRIEILRGGQSALYGSQAVGGVISITTRRAEKDGLSQSAALELGSYDTLRGSYGVSWREGGDELSATLSRVRTDGFSAADENDGNTEPDGFDATRLSVTGAHEMANGVRLGGSVFVEDARGEFDEGFPVADGTTDNVTDNSSVGVRGFAEFDAGGVSNTVAVTRYEISRDVTGTDGGFGANNLYEGARTGLSYLGTTDAGPARLRFGADVTRETFEQSGDYGPGSGAATVAGIFAEAALAPSEDTDLTLTLRYDDHDGFGGFLTGRIAGVYRASEDLIFRTSLATAFRAPSLYELYGPFGEPTLEPEESGTFDLGVERRFGEGNAVRATLFRMETTNLIDFPFPYAQVPGTVIRQGVELEADVGLTEDWRLRASYSYTDAENPPLTSGNTWTTLFGRHDMSLSAEGAVTDQLGAVLTLQHVADREGLPDYTVANAGLTYTLDENAEMYLRIENLFDEEYQLREGYGTSDRAFYVGYRRSF